MQDMLPFGDLWCHRGQMWLETLSQKPSPGCGQTECYSPLRKGKDDCVEEKMQSKEMVLLAQDFLNPALF